MPTFDFDIRAHEEYESLGLAARFMRGAEPMPAMTAAHDILEHFEQPGEAIDSDGECQALGAALYVRAESGGLQNAYNGPAQNLSGDVARLHTDAHQWGSISDPGRTCKLEPHVEEWISEAVRLAYRELCDDYGYPYEYRPGPQWRAYVHGWLRIGYRRARKRYAAQGIKYWTFDALERQIGAATKHTEEGALVRVVLCYNNPARFRVYTVEPWDSEHPDYIGSGYDDLDDDDW